MLPVGFEPTISAGERPQIYALDRAATGTGKPTGYNSQPVTAKVRSQPPFDKIPPDTGEHMREPQLHTQWDGADRLSRNIRKESALDADITEQRSSSPRPYQNLNTKSVRDEISNWVYLKKNY